MLNILTLHRELVCFVLDAFDLVDIPRLSLSDLGHLIGVPFALLSI